MATWAARCRRYLTSTVGQSLCQSCSTPLDSHPRHCACIPLVTLAVLLTPPPVTPGLFQSSSPCILKPLPPFNHPTGSPSSPHRTLLLRLTDGLVPLFRRSLGPQVTRFTSHVSVHRSRHASSPPERSSATTTPRSLSPTHHRTHRHTMPHTHMLIAYTHPPRPPCVRAQAHDAAPSAATPCPQSDGRSMSPGSANSPSPTARRVWQDHSPYSAT
jgi:hypothetical protein